MSSTIDDRYGNVLTIKDANAADIANSSTSALTLALSISFRLSFGYVVFFALLHWVCMCVQVPLMFVLIFIFYAVDVDEVYSGHEF